MGLSIHYSGTLKPDASIDLLIEEVKDICNVLNWEYTILDDDQVKGICVMPPESETVFLTFNNDRALCSPILLQYDIHPATQISTKTQYAGMEIHRSIITLFRHLNEKYFSVLEMLDESGYWETGDEKILEDQFNLYNTLLGMVSSAIKSFEKKEGESEAAMVSRLQKFLQEKFVNDEGESFIEIIRVDADKEKEGERN